MSTAHEKRVKARLYATDRMKTRADVFARLCQWCGARRLNAGDGFRYCPTCDVRPEPKGQVA